MACRERHPLWVTTASMIVCGVYYPPSTLDGSVIRVPILALYTVAAQGRLVAAGVLGTICVAGAG